jgi:ABC-type nitrate/sulfonate/bicarbonate transport system substrate-binding protein
MFKSTRILVAVTVLILAAVVLAACGPAPTPEAQVAAPTAQPQVVEVEVTRPPAKIVRFVFAPDPVMLYMQDTGIVDEYEQKYNMKLKTISTWDELAFFGGGHADIASTGDYEIPALMAESNEDLVVFGIYNLGRVPIFVKTDSPYQTIQDLKGKKIGVPGPLSSTMIWGVMLKATEGVDFRVGGGDFDLVVNDHMVNGELLRNGEIEAGVIIPEALVPEMRDGTVRLLYGAGGTWEYYRDNFDPEKKHKGVPGNIFLARKSWFEAHPDEVQFFLAMWQAGIEAWKANRKDIIRLYPTDWGLDPDSDTFDEDMATMVKFLTDHDWFVDSVYLDETWIQKELPLFDLMRETGFMPEDMPNPDFVPVKPEG